MKVRRPAIEKMTNRIIEDDIHLDDKALSNPRHCFNQASSIVTFASAEISPSSVITLISARGRLSSTKLSFDKDSVHRNQRTFPV